MNEDQLLNLVSETEEYASLISDSNYRREKFLLLTRTLLRPGVELSQAAQSFDLVLQLDNAAGNQLDVIGELIGASRELDYVPASGSREMDDDEYRMVLRLKIAQNTWDGTYGSLKTIYESVFGSGTSFVYKDNQDMTVDINVYGDISTRGLEIMERSGLLLVPVGVGKTVGVTGDSVTITIENGTGISGVEHVDGAVATWED